MPAPVLIEFNGKIASISEHCRDLGISRDVVYKKHERTNEPFIDILLYYIIILYIDILEFFMLKLS